MLAGIFVALGVSCTVLIGRRFLRQYRKCPNETLLSNKTIIVTGANSGIGLATALECAKRGAKVILACRTLSSAQETADKIQEITGNSQVIAKQLDLASFASIRQFCTDVLKEEARIDVLVNNAGIFNCPLSRTEEGFEMQFGVNHMGHFLLTSLLLDKLKSSGSARVLVLTSHMYSMGCLDFDDLNCQKRRYGGIRAYSDSKLANALFVRELANRLKREENNKVCVFAIDPGTVSTNVGRHTLPGWFYRTVNPPLVLTGLIRDGWEGCQTVIYACVEPSLEKHSGAILANCAIKTWNTKVTSGDSGERLWKESERLIQLATPKSKD